ncbi:hypothetical protein QTP88_015014 [Uroleucon formosanum]
MATINLKIIKIWYNKTAKLHVTNLILIIILSTGSKKVRLDVVFPPARPSGLVPKNEFQNRADYSQLGGRPVETTGSLYPILTAVLGRREIQQARVVRRCLWKFAHTSSGAVVKTVDTSGLSTPNQRRPTISRFEKPK